MKYNSIRPGQVWLDTNGNRIQAHGGSITVEDNYPKGAIFSFTLPLAEVNTDEQTSNLDH